MSEQHGLVMIVVGCAVYVLLAIILGLDLQLSSQYVLLGVIVGAIIMGLGAIIMARARKSHKDNGDG